VLDDRSASTHDLDLKAVELALRGLSGSVSYFARRMQRVRPLDHFRQRPLLLFLAVPDDFLRALVPLNLRQTFLPPDFPNLTHFLAMMLSLQVYFVGAMLPMSNKATTVRATNGKAQV
jgi:hypothetical protein